MSELKSRGNLTASEVHSITKLIPNSYLREQFDDMMSLQLNNHDRQSPKGTVSLSQAHQVLENLQDSAGKNGITETHIDKIKDFINGKL